LACHLPLGAPILAGVALTALDTLIVLGLKGKNFRQLVAGVAGCRRVRDCPKKPRTTGHANIRMRAL